MSRTAIAALVAACVVVIAAAVWLMKPKPVPPPLRPVAAAESPKPSPSLSPSPAPTVTRTVTATPSSSASTPAPPGSPWSVLSEFYGNVETGDYQAAWDLLGYDPGGETYQQFAAGYGCTSSQMLTEKSESGDTVYFRLTARNTCADARQVYSGSATVQNGKITSASITQLSGPAG